MNRQLFKALYLGLWAALAAGLVFLAHAYGAPWWEAAVAAYLLFVFINGSMAYVFVKRRLEAEGKQPPSYLVYLFFPRGIRHSVVVPRIVRIALGFVIFLGGVAFVFIGLVLGPNSPGRVQSVAILFVLALFGAAFIYVGFRLIVMRENDALFKRPNKTGVE